VEQMYADTFDDWDLARGWPRTPPVDNAYWAQPDPAM